MLLLFRIFPIIFCSFFIKFTHAGDTLRNGESISKWDRVVSAGEQFVLGFFPFENNHYYVGIWYAKCSQTVVWVANRESPFTDSSAAFGLTKGGSLVVSNGTGSSITIFVGAGNSTLTLLDSGNLVLREERSGRVIWQSFDDPTDTLLPGMKLDLSHSLTSWLSREVPTRGAYTLGVDPNGTAQLVIWERGVEYWTSGIWNGESFSSVPLLVQPMDLDYISYVRNAKGNYFTIIAKSTSAYKTTPSMRWVMDSGGGINRLAWSETTQSWSRFGAYDPDSCDDEARHYSPDGCIRQAGSQCSNGDSFTPYNTMIDFAFPDRYVGNSTLGISDCKNLCRRNCSCVAYAFGNDNGTGCHFWNHGSGSPKLGKREIYVRTGYKLIQDAGPSNPKTNNGERGSAETNKGLLVNGDKTFKRKMPVWSLIASSVVGLILISAYCVYYFKRRFKYEVKEETSHELLLLELGANLAAANKITGVREGKNKGSELELFSLATVEAATSNFSVANRLGEGGFGPVFKGKLEEGQEIAVKRLSRSSGQGLEEFKTEITLIARLQHTNLVRLLGCCITGEEKILIYEFMPNNSLDAFLFDPTRRKLLDWAKRIHIIEGISQGLLYLHKFSRLKIIHRDLKASNILLDGEMNPKISDFGMARIFEGNQNQANTKRVVGTYGYMSPEYAMEGIFSVKSDVFSFGVLLLEIISGKKNTSFYCSTLYINLLGYVWELWKDDRCSELIDPLMGDSIHTSNLMRHIHVGLLCVQERAVDRPTMSDVVYMLSNEFAPLSTPKQPAFTGERNVREEDLASINNMTISEMQAR